MDAPANERGIEAAQNLLRRLIEARALRRLGKDIEAGKLEYSAVVLLQTIGNDLDVDVTERSHSSRASMAEA